jgi:REP element-mobilizing transposase RayT
VPSRLTGWDYSANGAYFLTFCTSQRVRAFGEVHADGVRLSVLGTALAQQLLEITRARPGLCLDAWVIMPDHLHLIVVYEGQPEHRMPVDLLVAELKATVTWAARRRGLLAPRQPLWQRGFYDRVIRTEGELRQLREYIATNPCRWVQSGR